VLKGPGTVIAHPDGRVILQKEAPPWLATAGTGDVLSGMILGFLAQHVDSFDAASMAIWIHSHCAQTAGFGLIAEDLIEQIPTVMRNLLIHQHASSHL
jgi:NAD(P)H-hydrate repair Nnr-like enzyme with NAD(P)H-hydrate dehydratase domain